jgi:glycoside/pentoside/hexuronide:cation symporter, GPH family
MIEATVSPRNQSKLSRWRIAAFSAPAIAIAALGPPVAVFLPAFFVQDIGLGLTTVGIAFMAMRLANTALIPSIGAVLDATHGRFGRFRPWLVIGAALLCVAIVALFMARPGVGVMYLCGWLGLLYLANSICILSHSSWASVLSSDYADRSRVYGWWQGFNVLGTLLILLLPTLYFTDRTGYSESVNAMGWAIVLMFAPLLVLALAFATEPRTGKPSRPAGVGQYFSMLKRTTVRRILVACMLLEAVNNIRAPLTLFFFLHIKQLTASEVSLLLLVQLLGGLVGAACWGEFAAQRGKHVALTLTSISFCVSQLALFAAPVRAFWPIALIVLLGGMFSLAGPSLVRAMMADASDEEQAETGANRGALLQGLISMANNIGGAAAIGFAFVTLGLLGYRGNANDILGPAAAWGLPAMFIIVPGALSILIVLVMKNYPLTAQRHAEVRVQLSARESSL